MMAENPGFNQEMQSTGMAKQNPSYDMPPPGYGPSPSGGLYPPPAGGAYPGQVAPYPGYGPPGGYGPPVMQQPGSMQQSSSSTNVVVINQQQQPQQPTVRAWSSGLCACFDDCGICALVWWCMPCAGICLANDMGEYPCLLCCVPNALTAMRTKIRAQLKIPGSICDDCCITYWCQPCAMCQMMREVKQARAQGLI